MTQRQNLGILLALALGLIVGHVSNRDVNSAYAQPSAKPLAGITVDGTRIYKAYVDGSIEMCKVVQRPAEKVDSKSTSVTVTSVSVSKVDFYTKQARALRDTLKDRKLVCTPLPQHR